MELYKDAGNTDTETRVIKNSETIAERAFYYYDSTGANEADAVADFNYALAVGFRDKFGAPLGSGYRNTSVVTGTFTQSRLGNSYAASASNADSGGDAVVVQGRKVQPGDIYTAELDATVNTTTGSGVPGYYIAVLTTDATKLDENTATNTKSANTGFVLVDNGEGTNSAVNPERGGNWVLFQVAHIQDMTPATT